MQSLITCCIQSIQDVKPIFSQPISPKSEVIKRSSEFRAFQEEVDTQSAQYIGYENIHFVT